MEYNALHFYVYPGMDHVFQYLVYDLQKLEHCNVFFDIFTNGWITGVWRKIIYHPTFNYITNEWTTKISSRMLNFPDTIQEGDVFVFSNIAVQYIPVCCLKKIKKNGGKIVLYFLDDMANVNSKIALKKTQKIRFDLVFTFDKKNAEDYGFRHVYSMYSRLEQMTDVQKYGAVFIGSDKGRFDIIEKIYDRLIQETAPDKHFFSVFQTSEANALKYKDKMRINQSMDYREVVKVVQQSNCIIDIVIGEQSGLSLRAYEAIAYNKKLITNNPEIFNFPYYDERFMQYFSNVEDIDLEFIMKKTEVNYEYGEEYSPKRFLRRISELI